MVSCAILWFDIRITFFEEKIICILFNKEGGGSEIIKMLVYFYLIERELKIKNICIFLHFENNTSFDFSNCQILFRIKICIFFYLNKNLKVLLNFFRYVL